MNTPSKTLALLIDGDNAQLQHTKQIIQFCKARGALRIKNAFGDWKRLPLSAHCQSLTALGITCIQQNRVAKNSTDFALTSEVRSLLEKGEVDTYFLVSSDADFTTACDWIYQKGAKVIGIGSKNSTCGELPKSYNEFFYVEEIIEKQRKPPAKSSPKPSPILEILIQAHEKAPQKDGWVHLGQFGELLRQTDNQFEQRFAGKRLSTWFKEFPQKFEVVGDHVRIRAAKGTP